MSRLKWFFNPFERAGSIAKIKLHLHTTALYYVHALGKFSFDIYHPELITSLSTSC